MRNDNPQGVAVERVAYERKIRYRFEMPREKGKRNADLKHPIAADKLRELAEMLEVLAATTRAAIADLHDRKVDAIPLAGWPTLVLGLDYVAKLVIKTAMPSDLPIHNLDIERLRLDVTKDRVQAAYERAAEPEQVYEGRDKTKSPSVAKRRKAKE